MFQSLLQIQYCALTRTILNGGILCMHNAAQEILIQHSCVGFPVQIHLVRGMGAVIVSTATIFQSTAVIK